MVAESRCCVVTVSVQQIGPMAGNQLCGLELRHQTHKRHSRECRPARWRRRDASRGLRCKMCVWQMCSGCWGPDGCSAMMERSRGGTDSAFWVAQSGVIKDACDLISHLCTNNNGSVSHRLQWHKHRPHRRLDRWPMIALHPYPLRHYHCCLHRSLAPCKCMCVGVSPSSISGENWDTGWIRKFNIN